MIKATGRYFCDFLQSVDNIHLQMRFTYRKMKSPSMQITDVDQNGAVLIYRSSRSGFSKYLMGTMNQANCLINFMSFETLIPINSVDPIRPASWDSKWDLWAGFESEDSRSRERHQRRHSWAHWLGERIKISRSEVSIRFRQLGICNEF